jgi:hypothetical protein
MRTSPRATKEFPYLFDRMQKTLNDVGSTHSESRASQSQARNQPTLSNGWYTHNDVFSIGLTQGYIRRYSDGRKSPYKIMITKMFAPLDKAKPVTENIRGLNLAAVKYTTVQVTRLPL